MSGTREDGRRIQWTQAQEDSLRSPQTSKFLDSLDATFRTLTWGDGESDFTVYHPLPFLQMFRTIEHPTGERLMIFYFTEEEIEIWED